MAYYQYPDGAVFKLDFTPSMGGGAVKLTKAEGEKALAKYCQRELKKVLKPGKTVYVVLRSVSSSGMSRRLSLFVPVRSREHGLQMRDITLNAADAMGWSSRDGELVASGCGMDMGFHAVYCLGEALWPKGTRKPHGQRNGKPDHAGGYALKYQWL